MLHPCVSWDSVILFCWKQVLCNWQEMGSMLAGSNQSLFSLQGTRHRTEVYYRISLWLRWVGATVLASPPETSCSHGVMGTLYSNHGVACFRSLVCSIVKCWLIPAPIAFYFSGVEYSVVSWQIKAKNLLQCLILLIYLMSTSWAGTVPGTGSRRWCDWEDKGQRIFMAHMVKFYIFIVKTVMFLYWPFLLYLEASEIWCPREHSSMTVRSLLLWPLWGIVFTFLSFYSFFEDFVYHVLFIFTLPITSTISTPDQLCVLFFFLSPTIKPSLSCPYILGWVVFHRWTYQGKCSSTKPTSLSQQLPVAKRTSAGAGLQSAFLSSFWDWVWLELA